MVEGIKCTRARDHNNGSRWRNAQRSRDNNFPGDSKLLRLHATVSVRVWPEATDGGRCWWRRRLRASTKEKPTRTGGGGLSSPLLCCAHMNCVIQRTCCLFDDLFAYGCSVWCGPSVSEVASDSSCSVGLVCVRVWISATWVVVIVFQQLLVAWQNCHRRTCGRLPLSGILVAAV